MISQHSNISLRFQKHFLWNDENYFIDVIAFRGASDDEKLAYNLSEGNFLVHLFSPNSCKTFSVFLDEKLEWNTSASKLLISDDDLIKRIGFLIDAVYA